MQASLFNIPAKLVHTSNGTQGSTATRNGLAIEAAIYGLLTVLNVKVNQQFKPGWIGLKDQQIRVDLYCHPCNQFPQGLVIESRWQQSGGTVEDKLMHVVVQMIECYKAPSVLLVAGGGATDSYVSLVKQKFEGKNNIELIATSIDELFGWILAHF